MPTPKAILHTVPGSADTRRSPRFYTYAIVGEFDREAAEAANRRFMTSIAKDNWDYASAVARATPGVPVVFPPRFANDRPTVLTYSAEEIERQMRFLDQHPSRDAYVAFLVEERAPKQLDGTLRVLQWSQSERAAQNAVGSFAKRGSFRNVRVVRTVRG